MNIPFNTIRKTTKSFIGDGKYEGKIDYVTGREWNGKRYIRIEVLIKEVESDVRLFKNIPFEWSEGGQLENTLRKLRALPKEGEGINTDKLKDLPVLIEVKNNFKDGTRYSNIINIEKIEEQVKGEVQNVVKKERGRKVKITPNLQRKKPIVAPVTVTDYEEEIEETFED